MPKYNTDRITKRAIVLHFLPIKARVEFKLCLLGHKCLLSGETLYIEKLLQPVYTEMAEENVKDTIYFQIQSILEH